MIIYPDPILREECKEVKEGENVSDIIDNMIEEMLENDGIGIAAPQIGSNKRIIVVDKNGPYIVINPVITKQSSAVFKSQEGCLSVPGKTVRIIRKKIIKVHGFNRNREKITTKVRGEMAAVFQHEIDHLNGKLITDYV